MSLTDRDINLNILRKNVLVSGSRAHKPALRSSTGLRLLVLDQLFCADDYPVNVWPTGVL